MGYNPLLPAGQATSANSNPVVIASDQSAVPVTVSGVATAANQVTTIGHIDGIETSLNTLNAKDFATQTTSAAILAKIIAAPATEAKQDSMITQINALSDKFTVLTEIPADDTDGDGIAVRLLPSHGSRIGFTKTLSNSVDPEWGSIITTGSGMTVNQTGGNLVITAGTTARSESIIRSAGSWKGGVRLRARSLLSQRIANNNFFVELVDVVGDSLAYTINSATSITVTIPSNPFTADNIGQSMYLGAFSGSGTFLSGRYPIASIAGNDVTFTVSAFAAGTGTCSIFGWNYYQLLYTGTTATQASYDTQRNGWNFGATTATINTTASPGHIAIITGNDLTSTLADQLAASSTTIAQTVRATRSDNVPDDARLSLQIRVANGSTSPASNTTWTIGVVSVTNYANQDVVIQDVRPMSNAQALPVEILRSASLATTISSGTVTTVSTVTAVTNLNGGQTARSAASTGNPVRVGGRVVATTAATQDTSLVATDASDLPLTTSDQVINKPFATAEVDWSYVAATGGIVNTTTAVTIKAASGTASIRNYITAIQISTDTLGAATELAIRDGAAGPVLWRLKLNTAAISPTTIIFPTPLRGSSNTLLEVVTLSATVTGGVFFNAQGYTGF